MLPGWRDDLKVCIEFADITMLANEMGQLATSILTYYLDIAKFSLKRLF
jgi:hypothetical protein